MQVDISHILWLLECPGHEGDVALSGEQVHTETGDSDDS